VRLLADARSGPWPPADGSPEESLSVSIDVIHSEMLFPSSSVLRRGLTQSHCWPMYREDEDAYIQNAIIFLDEIEGPFDPAAPRKLLLTGSVMAVIRQEAEYGLSLSTSNAGRQLRR
jgi:hypothetical protein